MTTKRWLVLGLAVATVAAIVGDALRTPSDALRSPRRIVAGQGGVCAFFDGAPMQCWGVTRFENRMHPYAQVSTRPNATDLASSWTVSCVLDHGILDCPDVRGAIHRPGLRTPPSFEEVQSPVASLSAVCVLARFAGSPASAFCHAVSLAEHDTAPLDGLWQPMELGDPTSLALGQDTLCGLQRDGRIRCRALSTSEVYDVVGVEGAVQLALGNDFGCARDARGAVRCWGNNAWGQLGDGTHADHSDARLIALPTPATDLVARDGRACAISEGRPLCWGELWPGSARPRETASRPRRVVELNGLRQLALGTAFTCALHDDGTVRCWGYDAGGALGSGASLPSAGCDREGIAGTSPEPERQGGPTIVRTGASGRFPRARGPLGLAVALLVLGPLVLAWRSASAAFRPGEPRDRGARFAVHGAALLWALFVPVFVTRVAPALQASNRMFENWGLGQRAFEVTLACLGALLPAIMTTRLLISTLRTLERGGDLLRAARRGATPLLGVACPTLILSMLVTPSLNKAAETELVYQVRDGALKLWPLFVVRWMWTVGWLALAAGYLVGLGVWWHRMRTWASATRW